MVLPQKKKCPSSTCAHVKKMLSDKQTFLDFKSCHGLTDKESTLKENKPLSVYQLNCIMLETRRDTFSLSLSLIHYLSDISST